MIPKGFAFLAGALALFLSCNLQASPITLAQGESATFNFDATALTPYTGMGIEWTFSDFDVGSDAVWGETYPAVDAQGSIRVPSIYVGVGGDPLAAGSTNYLDGPHSDADLLDGAFSFLVTATAGTFTVDVVGLIYAATGQVTRISALSNGVPVPATLALLGLGLAGIGYGRRKQVNAA